MKDLSKYSDPTNFIKGTASLQNGVDLFDWTCKIPDPDIVSGSYRVFESIDPRPSMVIEHFESIKNWEILDLGTFEGAHAFQLEKDGANVTAIEAHPQNYLKCLIVKNALGMKTKFLLGDFHKYMDSFEGKYDLIFASGVLYHMPDPALFLKSMSQITKNLFIWSHYVSSDHANNWDPTFIEKRNLDGKVYTYYNYEYDPERPDRVYAGIENKCNRMTLEDIESCLDKYNYKTIKLLENRTDHPGGPAFSLIAEQDLE